MNNKEVKVIIEEVLSKLLKTDALLTQYFNNGVIIEHEPILNNIKKSIGKLEDLAKDLDSNPL